MSPERYMQMSALNNEDRGDKVMIFEDLPKSEETYLAS